MPTDLLKQFRNSKSNGKSAQLPRLKLLHPTFTQVISFRDKTLSCESG